MAGLAVSAAAVFRAWEAAEIPAVDVETIGVIEIATAADVDVTVATAGSVVIAAIVAARAAAKNPPARSR